MSKTNFLAVGHIFFSSSLSSLCEGEKKYISRAAWEAIHIWVGAWKLPLTLTFNIWLLSVWNID